MRASLSSKALLAIALIFAAIFGMHGLNAYHVLSQKAKAQQDVTESVSRWRDNYMALAETVRLWENNYRREDTVQDLMSLVTVANLPAYGLSADMDAIGLSKVTPVTQNGIPIGLTQICVSSAGSGESSALEVHAGNYQTLFAGLKRLAQRPDVYIGAISIKGDKPEPVAELSDFCLLMSKD